MTWTAPRYVIEGYGWANSVTMEWHQVAATNDEPYARHLLLVMFGRPNVQALRLIDRDVDELLAIVGVAPDA